MQCNQRAKQADSDQREQQRGEPLPPAGWSCWNHQIICRVLCKINRWRSPLLRRSQGLDIHYVRLLSAPFRHLTRFWYRRNRKLRATQIRRIGRNTLPQSLSRNNPILTTDFFIRHLPWLACYISKSRGCSAHGVLNSRLHSCPLQSLFRVRMKRSSLNGREHVTDRLQCRTSNSRS
ncbi:MAG: hypothetical protein HYY59_02045 [Candidatus Omnitrophica bacterium]|nr:hypothetical protein [Candidatus Omnitrophota bacterium]